MAGQHAPKRHRPGAPPQNTSAWSSAGCGYGCRARRGPARHTIINAGALNAFEKDRSRPGRATPAKPDQARRWPPGTITGIGSAAVARHDSGPTQAITTAVHAPLIAEAVELALHASTALPTPSDPEFTPTATDLLADLRRLESVATTAARSATGTPPVVLALSSVRRSHTDVPLRAARSPAATRRRRSAARHRADLSAAETANAAGLSVRRQHGRRGPTPDSAGPRRRHRNPDRPVVGEWKGRLPHRLRSSVGRTMTDAHHAGPALAARAALLAPATELDPTHPRAGGRPARGPDQTLRVRRPGVPPTGPHPALDPQHRVDNLDLPLPRLRHRQTPACRAEGAARQPATAESVVPVRPHDDQVSAARCAPGRGQPSTPSGTSATPGCDYRGPVDPVMTAATCSTNRSTAARWSSRALTISSDIRMYSRTRTFRNPTVMPSAFGRSAVPRRRIASPLSAGGPPGRRLSRGAVRCRCQPRWP